MTAGIGERQATVSGGGGIIVGTEKGNFVSSGKAILRVGQKESNNNGRFIEP